MKSYELEPKYGTSQIPGKCLKCLGEQELNNCLLELLRTEEDDEEVIQRFEALVTFLQSPESKKLRDESEKLLSEGKRVTLKIKVAKNTENPSYELVTE
ncbi:MAG: hypothetical protein KAS25_00555 [Dehalococcoidales bacterium]|nr:hypothetical protein [Dehalococcoidales bacterium]